MSFQDKFSQQKFLMQVEANIKVDETTHISFTPTEDSIDLPIRTYVCGIYGYKRQLGNIKKPLFLGGIITEANPSYLEKMVKVCFQKDLYHKDEYWYSWENISALRLIGSLNEKREKSS